VVRRPQFRTPTKRRRAFYEVENPMKTPSLKILAALLALATLLGACSSDSGGSDTDTTDSTEVDTTDSTVADTTDSTEAE
jgi:ABC-type oligopeptide transport system substrate-binding subunit